MAVDIGGSCEGDIGKVGTVVIEAGGAMAGKQVGGIDGRDDNNLAREWHDRRYYFTYACHGATLLIAFHRMIL
jgi:hypothetical protein